MSDFNTSKVDGNTVGSAEWNQLSDVDNLTTTSGQTPSTTDLFQLSIASARYSSGGQFFTDSGTANTYVLSPVSPFKSPVDATNTYFNGMTIRFRAGNANSGASTVNVNGAGSKDLKKEDGSTDLTAGDILTTKDSTFRYNGTSFVLVQDIRPASTTNQGVSYLNNPITISNNVSNPNTQMDIGACNVNYDNGGGQLLCQAITKTLQSSGAWTAGTNQNGLDTGARANSTYYNIFEIVKNSDNTSDILYSTSRTTPTVPSGYTLVAWIGAIRTDASGNIDPKYSIIRTRFGQIARFQTGIYASGTGLIPEDNTIPQNTEGDEYMALQITPLNAQSKLEINVLAFISNSISNPRIGALFQDSTTNALCSGSHFDSIPSAMTPLNINHFMTSGTTNATTFKFRAGGAIAGTTYFNGLSGGQLFNGNMSSSITIKEFY
jgi:hypothetical protein